MNKRKKIRSKEIGLEIALIFSRQFLKTEDLHYGYWTSDLNIDLVNLPQAQENHSNLIISHIPKGTRKILDVGSGAGKFALKLINIGYQVDCVCPNPLFSKRARELLGNKSRVFECCYEELRTKNRYDVVLFSESFQYVNLEKALQNSFRFLGETGYLLICDFFKTDAEGESVITGGHKLARFYDCISQSPFKLIRDIDITKETVPTLTILSDLATNFGLPTLNSIAYFLNNNYTLLSKLLQWRYRKRIEKINQQCLAATRLADNYATLQSYRLLLYEKTSRSIEKTEKEQRLRKDGCVV